MKEIHKDHVNYDLFPENSPIFKNYYNFYKKIFPRATEIFQIIYEIPEHKISSLLKKTEENVIQNYYNTLREIDKLYYSEVKNNNKVIIMDFPCRNNQLLKINPN